MKKTKTNPSKNHYSINCAGKIKFSLVFKKMLWNKYHKKCAYCACDIPSYNKMNVDHFISISKSGSNDIENLISSCSSCNFSKGNRDIDFLRIAIPLKKSNLAGVISTTQAIKLIEIGIDIGIIPVKFFFEDMMIGGMK